ncbi:putative secondary metabolism biosynthetic enzyme [Elasticomyces elasticus]|nr:putative secondary metabolism biosynthetic enzyme [Elasticomyces elasticus]
MALVTENNGTTLLVLGIDGMHYQSLGSAARQENDVDESQMCMTVEWDQSLLLAKPGDLKESLMLPPNPGELTLNEDLKRATFHIIHDTLAVLTEADIGNLERHHQLLLEWMRHQVERASRNEFSPRSSRWAKSSDGVKQILYDNVSSRSINRKMLCRIGAKLLSILRKEVAPLELMLEGKLLYSYYEKALRVDHSLSQVEKLVGLFAHHNPRGKILEIGGGTGACTGPVLKALGGGKPGSSPRFARYDFTDISSGFFESAREKFQAWADLISYKKLDIEQDLAQQAFELGSYDLIIACQVLHATRAIEHTMTNVRRLLKPGGRLIVVETTQDAVDVQLVFGTLPGWWLSERERKYSPNLPLGLWEAILTRTGFTGLDVDVRDCEDDENYAMSVIMSTAKLDAPPKFHPETVLVYADKPPPMSRIDELKASIAILTSSTPIVQSLDHLDVEGKICIFLSEIEEPLLSRVDPTRFKAIQTLLNESKGVLWVTCGAAIDCENPETALHTGLLRTRRLEDIGKRYIALDVDPRNGSWDATTAEAILNVFKATFDYSVEKDTIDFEYAQRDSKILVSRIHGDPAEDEAVSPDSDNLTPEIQPFHQAGRELRMDISVAGLLDSLTFRDEPSAGEHLPDDYVEIEPKAFGLNFRDIMVAMGQLKERVMGFECGGVITRVGPDVSNDFKVGDRVCALTTRGHWANHIRIHWTGVGHIPDYMSFEAAASVPMVFVTAYYSLFDTARLEKGETVLIHAASGGVGQAAIVLSKWVGAEVFATVGSQEKRDFLINTYSIAPDHIFSSRDPSFVAEVMAATGGKGVDVLLNSLAGEMLQESWNCVATLGRFVEIGKRDIQLNKRLEMGPFGRAISFSAVDLIHLGNHKGHTMSRVMAKVLQFLDEKKIQPIQPITVYPISEIQRAFRLMQMGKHLGKIIVKPSPGDMVKVLPQKRTVRLLPDASYLLVGGLGGIGRSIAQWLVQCGAKNLILLSRSAASQNNSRAFVEGLRATDCYVAIKNCDIADRGDLARIMDECSRSMPPVRGVIQAAMVLKDSVFERMNFDQWEGAIRPKVAGTYNLHKQFGDALDFFIMLSSATGILGNTRQANYAAGGTFQDAFARYRTSKGLPAISIDLGMVKSVGYVAETKGVAERLAKMGYRPLEEDEVLRIIEAAVRTPVRQQQSSQIVTGLASFESADHIAWRQELRFAGLKKHQTSSRVQGGHSGRKDGNSFKDSLADAVSWNDAVGIVTEGITKKLAEMFIIPEAEIDKSQSLSKYGVDSLVAVELRNWLVSRI